MQNNTYEDYELITKDDNGILQVGILKDNIDENMPEMRWSRDDADLIISASSRVDRYLAVPGFLLDQIESNGVMFLLDVDREKVYEIAR